jgi:hypothetical protein
MAQDLIKLVEEAEAAADELPSPHEAAVASRQAERAVQRLRDSAQQLSAVAGALAGERNGFEPQPPTAAAGSHPQSHEPAAVANSTS